MTDIIDQTSKSVKWFISSSDSRLLFPLECDGILHANWCLGIGLCAQCKSLPPLNVILSIGSEIAGTCHVPWHVQLQLQLMVIFNFVLILVWKKNVDPLVWNWTSIRDQHKLSEWTQYLIWFFSTKYQNFVSQRTLKICITYLLCRRRTYFGSFHIK